MAKENSYLEYLPLLTENERKKGVLRPIFTGTQNLLAKMSDDFYNFVAALGPSPVKGIYIYKQGNVALQEYDLKNHNYVFSVKSEDSQERYLTRFYCTSRGAELEAAELMVSCTCKWRMAKRPARLCKHAFASMLWLVQNKPSDFPKFRQLARLVFFAASIAKPGNFLWNKIKREEPEDHKKTKGKLKKRLEGILIPENGLKERAIEDFIGHLNEPGDNGLSDYEYQSARAIIALLNAILGGRDERDYTSWVDGMKMVESSIDKPEMLCHTKFMKKQMWTMRNIAQAYTEGELPPVVRQALKIWEWGVAWRERDLLRIKKGEVSGYSQETKANMVLELLFVNKIWHTHEYVLIFLKELEEQAQGSPDKALGRLLK